jgi:hypothetical protein
MYDQALQKTVDLGIKGGLAKGLGMGTVYLLLYFTWALLLWFAGKMVQKGNIHGGPAFVTILNAVVGGMYAFIPSSLDLSSALSFSFPMKGVEVGMNLMDCFIHFLLQSHRPSIP